MSYTYRHIYHPIPKYVKKSTQRQRNKKGLSYNLLPLCYILNLNNSSWSILCFYLKCLIPFLVRLMNLVKYLTLLIDSTTKTFFEFGSAEKLSMRQSLFQFKFFDKIHEFVVCTFCYFSKVNRNCCDLA